MTQTEHLQRIRARCLELLALAEKRTPGKWNTQTRSYQVQTNEGGVGRYVAEMMTYTSCERDADAAFIATCAGPAEAGWKATIAAIDNLQLIHEQTDLGEYAAWDALAAIIAAWPEEVL